MFKIKITIDTDSVSAKYKILSSVVKSKVYIERLDKGELVVGVGDIPVGIDNYEELDVFKSYIDRNDDSLLVPFFSHVILTIYNQLPFFYQLMRPFIEVEKSISISDHLGNDYKEIIKSVIEKSGAKSVEFLD